MPDMLSPSAVRMLMSKRTPGAPAECLRPQRGRLRLLIFCGEAVDHELDQLGVAHVGAVDGARRVAVGGHVAAIASGSSEAR